MTTTSTIPEGDDPATTVFAVAPAPGIDNDHSPEKVATAHERDMVALRDMVKEGRYNYAVPTNGDTEALSTIDPADGVLELLHKLPDSGNPKNPKFQQAVDKPSSSAKTSIHGPIGRSMKKFGTKKTTTAADFFASHGNKKSSNNNASNTQKMEADKSSPTSISTAKAGSARMENKSSSTAGANASTKPNPARNEKENTINNRGSSSTSDDKEAKVGNADDFVGDMDDGSDDDEDVVEVNPPPTFKFGTRSNGSEEHDGSSDKPIEPEDDPATMDASTTDATTNTSSKITLDPNRKRKRRKRLVEKTTMQNGYLRTETQAIWEDVPTDEEEQEEQAAADRRNTASKVPSSFSSSKQSGKTTKSSAQRSTKQQSLMGFFAKKK